MPYKDPEQRRAYGREWMKRNAEKAREGMRRWRRRHPEEHLAEVRAYYQRNRERVDARTAAYRRRRPEVKMVIWQRRRAREVAGGGRFTGNEWNDLVERHSNRCAYCGAQEALQPDHRVALARGGSNTIDNILPACRRCNQQKHTSSEREFRVRLANERLRSTEFVVVDWWPAGEIESVG